jgi:hypothetical protein
LASIRQVRHGVIGTIVQTLSFLSLDCVVCSEARCARADRWQ